MSPDSKEKAGERLQVVLARFGLASRRGVVALIEAGQVTVNGKPVLEKGFRVKEGQDQIAVNGETLSSAPRDKRYFVLNKPKGVMTTLQDPHAESTVADFFKDADVRLFPVGRLDRDTTGLLLMTNDGELAFRLMHPKFGVQKKYRVEVYGDVLAEKITQLEKGVRLEEGKTAPCKIEVEQKTSRGTLLYVTLHEGKKRQVRRIFEKVGCKVRSLERVQFGPLLLGSLREGQRRELTAQEANQLKAAAGLGPPKRARKSA